MTKKTNKLVLKKECKHSFVFEPQPGTPPAEVITTGVYIQKSAVPPGTKEITLTIET